MRARANAAAFRALQTRAPEGVDVGFNEAAPYGSFWSRVMLPDFADSRVTHPVRVKPPDPMVEIALQSAAFAKAFDAKMLMTAAQQNARDDKAEAEQRQKNAEARERYHQELLAAERRRVTGG